MHSPDPTLTASLYSNRGLDALVADVVAPFWKRVTVDAPGHGWTLWLVRYSRCGDHLKVRLHGPEAQKEWVMRLLEEEAERHFAALPPVDEGAARVSRKDAPPIDEDDRAGEDYPDRTLRWTRYQRSFVNFGWKNHLDDDGYVSRMTVGFAAGAARVLDAVEAAGGRFPAAGRQTVLLKAVIAGLAALDLTAEARAEYLAYHRDWLVRWTAADAERGAVALNIYDRRVEAMGAAAEQVGHAAIAQWEHGAAEAGATAWGAASAELARYVSPFQGKAAYDMDPFTDNPLFPPLFKLFHGLANTLGIGMLDEGFTHHLLLCKAAAPASVVV